jgi:hypothetical protein
MTFKHLTAGRGKELLTLYLAGFHAKTFPQQGKAQGLTESEAECGERWRGWLAKYDPDSCSWKTAQCLLEEGLVKSLEIWPRWGLMRDGECWEQPTLVPHTKGTGSGSWPTPTVCGNYNRKGLSKTSGDGLATAVKKWPTPTVNDSKNSTLPPSQIKHDNIPGAMLRDGEAPGGQLNPTWVEWLMGWPLGWTDLKPSETDKFQQWQQQHLGC